MLECFTDYIGLSYCGGAYEQPESGVYLNTLPGITIESIQSIAQEEQGTYLHVWADVQSSARVQLKRDAISELTKCFSLNKECDYEAMICANKEILLDAWRYLCAMWLMQFRLYSDRLNRYTTIDITRAQELRELYGNEYAESLRQSVQMMDVSSCELCCGGNPEYVYNLP